MYTLLLLLFKRTSLIPLALLLTGHLLSAFTIAFVPLRSYLRPFVVLLNIILAVWIYLTNAVLCESVSERINLLIMACTNSLHSYELLCAHKETYDRELRREELHFRAIDIRISKGSASTWSLFLNAYRQSSRTFFRAFRICCSSRRIGTSQQPNSIPRFSWKKPSYVPSRSKFLIRCIFGALIPSILLNDFCSSLRPADPSTITIRKQSLFFRAEEVTMNELVTRIYMTCLLWTNAVAVIQIRYNVLAVLAVGTGLSPVEDWPPMFGRVTDAWSVRQFWGVTYHQMLRVPLTAATTKILQVSRIPRKTLTYRYLHLFVVFLISGLFHDIGCRAVGWSKSDCGWVKFMFMQALGIVVEDGVQFVGRTINAETTPKKQHTSFWQRLFGYVWIIAFFSWTTPGFMFGSMRAQQGGLDHSVPFAIFAKQR